MDQGNTPTVNVGPRILTICLDETKPAAKGPENHTNLNEGTKETWQLSKKDHGNTPTA
jgi:hypothetical protein